MGLLKSIFGDYSSRELKSIYPIVDKIEALGDEYKALTDAELQAKTPEISGPAGIRLDMEWQAFFESGSNQSALAAKLVNTHPSYAD